MKMVVHNGKPCLEIEATLHDGRKLAVIIDLTTIPVGERRLPLGSTTLAKALETPLSIEVTEA